MWCDSDFSEYNYPLCELSRNKWWTRQKRNMMHIDKQWVTGCMAELTVRLGMQRCENESDKLWSSPPQAGCRYVPSSRVNCHNSRITKKSINLLLPRCRVCHLSAIAALGDEPYTAHNGECSTPDGCATLSFLSHFHNQCALVLFERQSDVVNNWRPDTRSLSVHKQRCLCLADLHAPYDYDEYSEGEMMHWKGAFCHWWCRPRTSVITRRRRLVLLLYKVTSALTIKVHQPLLIFFLSIR